MPVVICKVSQCPKGEDGAPIMCRYCADGAGEAQSAESQQLKGIIAALPTTYINIPERAVVRVAAYDMKRTYI
jgi:hypothetical protein